MKFIDEFRDPRLAHALAKEIRKRSRQPIRLMEFCGGHTHAILRFGIRQMLSDHVEMLSGPGCPVCVTSSMDLDRAIAMAKIPGVILATFGDMIRVPGSQGSIQDARIDGADIRVVYSSMDAVHLARKNAGRPVIFLGVGFETTAPGVAASILEANEQRLDNYFVLSLHKFTPPAIQAILNAGDLKLSGILGPGHVTTVIGTDAWRFLTEEFRLPFVVAGFEPLDILRGIGMLVNQIDEGLTRVENAYSRAILPQGNLSALAVMNQVFEPCDAEWRGLAKIPDSGMDIRAEYARFDASKVFPATAKSGDAPSGCRCGEVLRGILTPLQCPLFHRTCNPENPLGPCMVSSEGACAAHHQFGEKSFED